MKNAPPSSALPIRQDSEQTTILLVDDEASLRRVLGAVLQEDGYRVLVADSGRAAVKTARGEPHIDLVLADYLMPDLSGLETVAELRKAHPDIRVLFLSGHATVRVAVEAMRMGAFDFLTKPFDVEAIRQTIRKALASDAAALARVPERRPKASDRNGAAVESDFGLIGESTAARELRHLLLRAAPTSATVLLLGETGTGKEVAAKLLHEASARRDRPFVAVSCAALPETLLESELWGYEKHAFTGADACKPGRFELANGGTLFLDEIGDIPLATQVKLLRVLQEREFFRLGGTRSIRVDVRVVAATNRDLMQAVKEGTFRADLFYRLSVVPVVIPPLRERLADIPRLANFFLKILATENKVGFADGFDEATMAALRAHRWPGNIRELRNVIEFCVVMAGPNASKIDIDCLPAYIHPDHI